MSKLYWNGTVVCISVSVSAFINSKVAWEAEIYEVIDRFPIVVK